MMHRDAEAMRTARRTVEAFMSVEFVVELARHGLQPFSAQPYDPSHIIIFSILLQHMVELVRYPRHPAREVSHSG